MKVKSITDVITNSSSEVFMIKSEGRSDKEILKILNSIKDDGCSGMGGYMEILNDRNMPDGIVLIDIDWSKEEVIKHIVKNFFLIGVDEGGKCTRDPETKRITSLWDENDQEDASEYYEIIENLIPDSEEFLNHIESLSWKQGLKYIFDNEYGYDLTNLYNSKKGFSDYNPDISPADNFRIWNEEKKEKLKEVLCKFGL